MRIGLITQWYPPEHGSAALPGTISAALSDAGHDVVVVTGYPNYPEGHLQPGWKQRAKHVESHDGVQVHRTPLYISHDGRAVPRMLNYLSFALSATVTALRTLRSVDAVWVHGTPALPALAAMTLKRLAGVPFVLHIQDLWPDTVTASGMLSPRVASVVGRPLEWFCRRSYTAASVIGVITPSMRDTLVHRGVPTEKILDIPNWANESIFRPGNIASSKRQELGIPPGFVAMYAGAVGEVQGLETLIRAAEFLQNDAIHIAIVGDGVARRRLIKMTADLRLENVTFIDPQPLTTMGDVLGSADLQVICLRDLPLYRITLPSKVQATMAAGRPLVVSASGDAGNVVRDAEAGLVCGAGDARALANAIMQAAATPPEELAAWGQSARRHYEKHFSERVGVQRMLSALRTASQEAPQRRHI